LTCTPSGGAAMVRFHCRYLQPMSKDLHPSLYSLRRSKRAKKYNWTIMFVFWSLYYNCFFSAELIAYHLTVRYEITVMRRRTTFRSTTVPQDHNIIMYYYNNIVLPGPVAHPASCTIGTWSFPGVKRPGRGVDHPPPSSTEVEGRVELYLNFPLLAFVTCSRENFTFTFTIVLQLPTVFSTVTCCTGL
jgi:hypothetical protein